MFNFPLDECMAIRHISICISIPLLATALLAGCKSGEPTQCVEVNWRELGEKAASLGQTKDVALNAEKNRCEDTYTKSNELIFDEGFQRGLALFCVEKNGYLFGLRGGLYDNTCPSSKETSFLKGYYQGRKEHLNAELEKHTKLYSEAEERLWRREREYLIIQNENAEQAKLEVDMIDAYREETRQLAKKKRDLTKEILKIERLKSERFL
jgi:transcriptional antiterminator Rof (Rho-off)